MIHELEFHSRPSNEELRQTISELGISAYRFVKYSEDGLFYWVEEVDIMASLARTSLIPSNHTWTVPVTITCTRCRKQYKGWEVVARKWNDNKSRHYQTDYCPECPMESVDSWLASMGIHQEQPTGPILAPERQVPTALTLTDLEDFD